MNTDLLKTFLEVAKTRHFGHAAENLFITQSAVSARIRQLEDTLGVPLFSRERKNVLLTAAGERLLSHAENLLSAWQLTVQEVGAPRQQYTQLSLGGSANLWDACLRHLLPKLAAAFPKLYIRTEVNHAQNLVRALLGRRIDILVTCDAPTHSEAAATVLGELDLVMVCNKPNHQVEDLTDLGHVFIDWGTSVNLQQAKLFPAFTAPRLHTSQSHIALDFILAHQGGAYLPKSTIATYLDTGQLFAITGAPEIKQSVYLLHRRDADPSTEHEAIRHFIEQTLFCTA